MHAAYMILPLLITTSCCCSIAAAVMLEYIHLVLLQNAIGDSLAPGGGNPKELPGRNTLIRELPLYLTACSPPETVFAHCMYPVKQRGENVDNTVRIHR